MSVIKVSLEYDHDKNMYTIKGLKKNAPAEVLERILETIKDETHTRDIHDLTIKLVGKDEVEVLSLQEFLKRIEESVKENKKEDDQPTPGCIIRITFYLSNGGMLQAECNLDTARDVMEAYEKPETRPCEFALFSDIHERHYAIPYDNITAAYCDFMDEGSELHDK